MERRAALHSHLSGSFAWLTGRRLAPANGSRGIAGDRCLAIDAAGNIHVSELGPAR